MEWSKPLPSSAGIIIFHTQLQRLRLQPPVHLAGADLNGRVTSATKPKMLFGGHRFRDVNNKIPRPERYSGRGCRAVCLSGHYVGIRVNRLKEQNHFFLVGRCSQSILETAISSTVLGVSNNTVEAFAGAVVQIGLHQMDAEQ